MAYTQLSSRTGSDAQIYEHDVPRHIRRSDFPLSYRNDFSADIGIYMPFFLKETLPGDVWDISLRYILKTQPLAVAPYTSYRVRTHYFYCPMYFLWKGAETMLTQGATGNVHMSVPTVDLFSYMSWREDASVDNPLDGVYYFGGPLGLPSYFGFRPSVYGVPRDGDYVFKYNDNHSNLFSWVNFGPSSLSSRLEFSFINGFSSDSHLSVNALPFFMYQKCYRYDMTVPNLLVSAGGNVWYPEDLSDGWRINYTASNLRAGVFSPDKDLSSESNIWSDTHSYILYNFPRVNDYGVNILTSRYCLWDEDRFTTALPWATRGTAPAIDVSSSADISLKNLVADFSQMDAPVIIRDPLYSSHIKVLRGHVESMTGSASASFVGDNFSSANPYPIGVNATVGSGTGVFNFRGSTSAVVSGLSFSIDELRNRLALDVWLQRNATVQGVYNALVDAHFGVSPNHQDFEPIYIGGTSDVISFNDVIQQVPTDNSAQGTTTGLGMSQGSGNVCKRFRTSDYGYIMGIMFITPDTSYVTGMDKLWSRSTREDFFFPEFEQLGLEPVKNKEIYFDGSAVDDGLFGYQERNTEYKASQNVACNYFALPSSVDIEYSAYTQARQFSSAPALSHQFVTMQPSTIRRDFLSDQSRPAFRITCANIVRASRPMAYKSHPNTFGF